MLAGSGLHPSGRPDGLQFFAREDTVSICGLLPTESVRGVGYVLDALLRDHNHAVDVAKNDVARAHGGAADDEGDLGVLGLLLAGDADRARGAAEQWIAEGPDLREVADGTMNDRRSDA